MNSWPVVPASVPYQFYQSSLQYGADKVASRHCGLMDIPGSITGRWDHGWVAPYKLKYPILATQTSVSRAAGKQFFVANQTISERLMQEGFAAVPIGLPIAYAKSPALARRESTLLVMPHHSTKESSLSCFFEAYVSEINKIRSSFDDVFVCLHASCIKKGYWVSEFKNQGYKIIRGGDPNDRNSLSRMQALFKQFEYVTTNAYGSCIAYASAYGAKVFVYGSFCQPSPCDFETDPFYMQNPDIVEIACAFAGESHLHANYPWLFCDGREARLNVDWGRAEIGASNLVTPSVMRALFGPNWTRFFCIKSRLKRVLF